ncbi:SF3B5 [Cordylochernes scorpioides]|uniref:SF3B5 n=1 Tax=Cordylochernes scorpioides TaxID=51811 RepID=A0ABY6KMF6_9ARAC|nr:SF3B5 [Cordylochernes scorpioides]
MEISEALHWTRQQQQKIDMDPEQQLYTPKIVDIGDRYNIHSQLEHLQSKYIGTGQCGYNKRDSFTDLSRAVVSGPVVEADTALCLQIKDPVAGEVREVAVEMVVWFSECQTSIMIAIIRTWDILASCNTMH